MRNFSALLPIMAAMLLVCCIQSVPAQRQRQHTRKTPRLPDSVKLIPDIPYAGTDHPRQMLDVILPARQDKTPLPVIVFIHGGGWRNGNKAAGHHRIIRYVASGTYAGVAVGYRLSEEATWPNQIHDCKAAIRWIRANATRYGMDADHIAVWGSSAGGHLAAMLGTSADVPAMDGTLGPHTNVPSRVTCVVDFHGPTDFLRMNRTAIREAKMDHDDRFSVAPPFRGDVLPGNLP